MNIHDLARHLNVSIGTVSRALNGRSDVSAETRKRVLEAATALGYSPNQSGRSLRQGATSMIGFMVTTKRERAAKDWNFFMSVFDGLHSSLTARGFDLLVLLCTADQDPNAYLRRVVERRLADGMVIAETQRIDPRIEYLQERRIPFVAFGRSLSGENYAWLDLDFEGVAEQAIERLTRLGHQRIAVATASTEINFGYVFIEAYRESLKRRGIRFDEGLVLREELTETGGFRVAERLLAMSDRPTAILLVDNKMATGLYRKLGEADVLPGRDIAVIGFDNTPQNQYLSPTLTCFRTELSELGARLGETLINEIDRKAAGTHKAMQTVWPMQMIVGESDSYRPRSVRAGRVSGRRK